MALSHQSPENSLLSGCWRKLRPCRSRKGSGGAKTLLPSGSGWHFACHFLAFQGLSGLNNFSRCCSYSPQCVLQGEGRGRQWPPSPAQLGALTLALSLPDHLDLPVWLP